MLILSAVKRQLKIIGVLAISKDDLPFSLQRYRPTINWIHITFMTISLITYHLATLNFLFFEANTFAEYADSGLYATAAILDVAVYLILIFKRSELLNVVINLERIILERIQVPEIHEIYSLKNEKSEKFAASVWNMILLCVEFLIIPIVLLSFYRFYTSDLNEKSFQQVFSATIPWNWKTSTGYLTSIALQFVWLNCALSVVACALSLFVGSCILFTGLAMDVREHLTDLKTSLIGNDQQYSMNANVELTEKLRNIIEFHSDSKDVIDHFSTACSPIITTFLGVAAALICGTLLGLNVSLANHATVDVLRTISSLIIVMNIPSVLCLTGDEVRSQFEMVNDLFDECGWYEFPLNTQKLLPMMIIMIQKPVCIQGYINTRCTRDAFKMITKAGFSYFTMLRKST